MTHTTRVAKGAGNVVHTVRADDTSRTDCGRQRLGLHTVYAGEEYLYNGPCGACMNYASRRPARNDAERWIREASAAPRMPARVAEAILANPAVTDARVIDDAQEAVSYDHANPVHRAEKVRNARLDSAAVSLAYDAGSVTVVSRDDTGDVLAEWRGCIVGARFTFAEDARTFLAGDRSVRPTPCRLEFGGYGACIRQASHGGQCADAHGHRFAGARRTTTAEYLAMRADAMERHPAGKGRTLRDHRADSERAADGSERPPASVIDAFTRRGYTVRRAARVRFGWLVMAYRPHGLKDNGTYTYVVGSIGEADREWCAGHYSVNPGTADANFRERLS